MRKLMFVLAFVLLPVTAFAQDGGASNAGQSGSACEMRISYPGCDPQKLAAENVRLTALAERLERRNEELAKQLAALNPASIKASVIRRQQGIIARQLRPIETRIEANRQAILRLQREMVQVRTDLGRTDKKVADLERSTNLAQEATDERITTLERRVDGVEQKQKEQRENPNHIGLRLGYLGFSSGAVSYSGLAFGAKYGWYRTKNAGVSVDFSYLISSGEKANGFAGGTSFLYGRQGFGFSAGVTGAWIGLGVHGVNIVSLGAAVGPTYRFSHVSIELLATPGATYYNQGDKSRQATSFGGLLYVSYDL